MTKYHLDTCAVLARVGLDELVWIADHRGGRLDCTDPMVAQAARFAVRWIWRWFVLSGRDEGPGAELAEHFAYVELLSAQTLASLDGVGWVDLDLGCEFLVYRLGRILALADTEIHPEPIRAERVL